MTPETLTASEFIAKIKSATEIAVRFVEKDQRLEMAILEDGEFAFYQTVGLAELGDFDFETLAEIVKRRNLDDPEARKALRRRNANSLPDHRE